MHFLIGAMLLVQFSIYAQSTGQVTLSIRLYPIQIIEVAPIESQTIELNNEDIASTPNSNPLSTFSTSLFASHVDSVNSKPFEMLRAARNVSLLTDNTIEKVFATEKYNHETDGDDLNVVYSMETLWIAFVCADLQICASYVNIERPPIQIRYVCIIYCA